MTKAEICTPGRVMIRPSPALTRETTEMKNPLRAIAEIELLSTHFGDVCYDPDDPSVVLIEHFNLPRGFNKRYCELLIDLGPNYPEFPPKDWYLSRGLRKRGRTSKHYFEDGFEGKEYCDEGFAWYSFHIKRWKPDPNTITRGDTLLAAVDAFHHALKSD